MTETKAPLGQASAVSQAASPHWLRRLDGSPGVIDTAEARRHYARTAGWAIQRIMRASDLASRYAGANRGGAANELLLARVPARISDQGESDAQGGAAGAAGADLGRLGHVAVSEPFAGDATTATSAAASGVAMRLQRRAAGSGMIKPDVPRAADHPAAGLSLRAGLHERLGARAGSAPPLAIQVARRMDRGNDVGPLAVRMALGNPTLAGRGPGTHADATSKPGSAARASVAAPSDEDVEAMPALVPSDVGGRSEAGVTQRTDASALQRKINDAQSDASARATAELRPAGQTSEAAAAESRRGARSTLPLAYPNAGGTSQTRVTRRSTAASPLRRKTSEPDVPATAHRSPAAPTTASVAALSPDSAGNLLPLARRPAQTSLTHRGGEAPILHRKTSDPSIDASVRSMQSPTSLALAREAAPFTSAQPDSETTLQLARVGMSAAQLPDVWSRSGADATAAPTLVWRAADNANPRARSARLPDGGSGGVLMRAGVGDVTDHGSASSWSTSAPVEAPVAGAPHAPSSPALDVNRLAEHIIGVIARRLEIERERRGGAGWH
jgi:hypothetical protein